MTIRTIRERLLASTMIGGVALAAAVALPAAAVMLAPTSASAQDYTTGALSGTVTNQAGTPIAGATVQIQSNDQGFARTTTTGANGQFRTSLVPQGSYTVSISAPGYTATTDENISVQVGSQASYTFALASADASTEVDEIVVVGTRPELDFSQSTSGLTVNVAELVTRVPLGRSVTAVTLLAPRTIQGDSAFGNTPSLGGSSVAENAFYVNGLNITNFNNYVGAAEVPFDFYRTIDVQTGGYPAEFGRATGGIVNATTKSGTNDFMFALHGNYAPDSMREDTPNVIGRDFYALRNTETGLSCGPLSSATCVSTLIKGSPVARNDQTESESWSMIAEAGGPIWRDHLYAYGLYQWQESRTRTVNNTNATETITKNDVPFWGAKIDAYLTDTQRLEFTYFNTEGDYSPVQQSVATGAFVGGSNVYVGGENWVARYTGNFTDWLTVSAAYGKNEDQNYTEPLDTTSIYAVDVRGGPPGIRVPGSNVSTTTALLKTEREFYRADADITFSYMGDHHVRLGFDNEDTTLTRFSQRTGGFSYFYYAGDGFFAPVGDDYLDVFVSTIGGGGAPIEGTNRAFYIQDSWDITPSLNVQIGLRHDEFILYNLAGDEVIDLKDNFGPRFAFSLDPFGNKTDKFYASYGRYFIPVASNLSYRGADLLYDAYFTPTAGGNYALNADGTPVGGLGTPAVNDDLQLCPANAPGGAAGLRACLVNGDGTAEPADAKYAEGTKATNEDEFVVGYERKLNDLWTVGAAVTFRKLNNVSEDIAVDYLVRQYCAANLEGSADDEDSEVGQCFAQFSGDHQYIIANPGEDLTFLVREALPNGERPVISFSKAEVELPKPKREYTALELTFDRAFDGKWSLNGSYVLSKSIGNYEGTVLSDNGQTDAGSTILYDHLGLVEGKYGLLPNHRAHQFKVFGSYQLFDGLTLGFNYSLQSPRHFGCLGRATTDTLSFGYGASAGVCRPDILAFAGNTDPTSAYTPIGLGTVGAVDTQAEYAAYAQTTPRGSAFAGDWTSNLDLSVRYTLPTFGMRFVPEGGITLRADVFNVFDEQAETDYVEVGGTSGTAASANYGLASGYQSPRFVRFGFDLTF